jgi:hypothetical protein
MPTCWSRLASGVGWDDPARAAAKFAATLPVLWHMSIENACVRVGCYQQIHRTCKGYMHTKRDAMPWQGS